MHDLRALRGAVLQRRRAVGPRAALASEIATEDTSGEAAKQNYTFCCRPRLGQRCMGTEMGAEDTSVEEGELGRVTE